MHYLFPSKANYEQKPVYKNKPEIKKINETYLNIIMLIYTYI